MRLNAKILDVAERHRQAQQQLEKENERLQKRVELLEHKLLLISELSEFNDYAIYRAAVQEIIWRQE